MRLIKMIWETRTERQTDYLKLEELQNSLTSMVAQNPERAFLLFSEPTPTYTCGRSGTADDLVWNEAEIIESNIQTVHVTRGGKWTYHGPGQLLVYPIVHLPTLGYSTKAVQRFMDDFRAATLQYLKSLGLAVEAGENPFGIYNGKRKLASFGFRFKRGVANHGMALYIAPQHNQFQGINPCGVPEQTLTSLDELGAKITWGDVASHLSEFIKKGFTLPKN